MHLYRCIVSHAGNRDMQIHKNEVTAAEIMMLRHHHGREFVTGVEFVREDRRQHPKEAERLANTYGRKLFAEMFPGASPRLPLTLRDAGLSEDGRDLEARAADPDDDEGADSVPEPSAAAKAIAAKVAAKRAQAEAPLT